LQGFGLASAAVPVRSIVGCVKMLIVICAHHHSGRSFVLIHWRTGASEHLKRQALHLISGCGHCKGSHFADYRESGIVLGANCPACEQMLVAWGIEMQGVQVLPPAI
jgi:hypothetical protein